MFSGEHLSSFQSFPLPLGTSISDWVPPPMLLQDLWSECALGSAFLGMIFFSSLLINFTSLTLIPSKFSFAVLACEINVIMQRMCTNFSIISQPPKVILENIFWNGSWGIHVY